MFLLERPDLTDRFANHFVTDEERNWYFQPRDDWPRLPVSEAEMLDAVEHYRRRSTIAMSALWITFFAAFLWFCWTAYSTNGRAVGLEHVLAFPAAFLLGFAAQAWALRSSFRPFHQRLLAYADDQPHPDPKIAEPEGPQSEIEPWISISANRGGCIVISILGFFAAYGLYRLLN